MNGWHNVTPKHPCAICGRPDWCRYHEDGAVQDCYRQGDAGAKERQDSNRVTYWRHRSGSAIPLHKRQYIPSPPSAERADASDVNRVYHALLILLSLGNHHRSDLHKRGLSDTDIARCGHGSLPLAGRYRIVKQLVHQFGQDLITRVPGFVTKSGERGAYLTLAGSPGLLIPVRNVNGTITGLNIRCDDAGDGGRYRWLSSKHAGGPAPEIITHVPTHHGDTGIIRITEGPLKADVATSLSGILTIGLPGVTAWKLCLPVLEQIQPSTVLLAFDADWRTNPNVAQSLSGVAICLHEAGFNVQVEDWRQELGKGIDDLLRNGCIPKRKHWIHALVCKRRGAAPKNKKGTVHAS